MAVRYPVEDGERHPETGYGPRPHPGHDWAPEEATDESGRSWAHVCLRCGIRCRETDFPGFFVYSKHHSGTSYTDCPGQAVAAVMKG